MVKAWSKVKDLFKKRSHQEIMEEAFGEEEERTFQEYEEKLKSKGIENVKKRPDFSMYIEPNICQRCEKKLENCTCNKDKDQESWLRVGF